jgi:thiol-disulfide isomerase/thioredoxin
MFNNKSILATILILAMAIIVSGCSTADQKENNNSAQNNPEPNPNVTEDNSETIKNGKETVVYFFWGVGCPHCADQKPWMEELEEKYPDLEVKMLETYKNQDNAKLFQEMAKAYGIQARGVPATFIGDSDPVVGFSERVKPSIENKIKACLNEGCIDPESKL